jgi:hypothetical protein
MIGQSESWTLMTGNTNRMAAIQIGAVQAGALSKDVLL